MVGAMQNAPLPTSSSQLVAIKVLHALLEKWRLLAPPSLLQYSRTPRLSWPSPTLQCSAPPTPIATQDQTNNPFLALEQDNCEEDVPSAPPWSPLCCQHWCHAPQLQPYVRAGSLRPHPRGSSLRPHPHPPHSNLSCRHLQGSLHHQAPGHNISQLPTKHGHAWQPRSSAPL
jgi:hypothetical protein